MKFSTLTNTQASALVDELREMADLPAGANAPVLLRAKEIRFQLQGQEGTSPSASDKADDVYHELTILLHPHRWRAEHSLDHLRKRIKSACERLRAHLGLASRPSA
ncbi:MAG: hypothetical protein JWL61_4181 [Gemmatimonadetes bacterium]|nr:hypothetical protein [Gemmatimonadota bacterium]